MGLRLSQTDMERLRRAHEIEVRNELLKEYEDMVVGLELQLLDARHAITGYRVREAELKRDLEFTRQFSEELSDALHKRSKEAQLRAEEKEQELAAAMQKIKFLQQKLAEYTDEGDIDEGYGAADGADVTPVSGMYGRMEDYYGGSPRSARSPQQRIYMQQDPAGVPGTPARSSPRSNQGSPRSPVGGPAAGTPGSEQYQQMYGYRQVASPGGDVTTPSDRYPTAGPSAPTTPGSAPDGMSATLGFWGKLTGKAAKEPEPGDHHAGVTGGGAGGDYASLAQRRAAGGLPSAGEDDFRDARSFLSRGSSISSDDLFDKEMQMEVARNQREDEATRREKEQAETARKWREEAELARKRRESAELARLKREEAAEFERKNSSANKGTFWSWPPVQPPASPRAVTETEPIIGPGAPKVAVLVAGLQGN